MVKGFLMVLAVLGIITATTISTKAYTEDSNGNLVSDNLINYQDINSSKFTDLGDNAFALSWRGEVTTFALPYSSFKANTQYTLSLTSVSGAKYWAYNIHWNYTDNTSERLTNNQGLNYGTYSYTSASNKTLASITWVCNFEANFKDLMLNEGTPKSFEPYGYTYYSQENYNNALLDNYGIFRLCSSIKLTLTWTDRQQVDSYEWDSILSLINDKSYVNCINGVFSYSNQELSEDYLNGTYNATAMWQFNFNGIYPLVKQYPYMLGSGYVSRYQIIDNNGTLFAYDNFPNDSNYVDLTQYQNKQIGYIQLYTGPVGAGSQVDTTSLYFDNSYDVAYTRGYEDGKIKGYDEGLDYGEKTGYDNGKNDGYDLGYNKGLEDGEASDFATNGFKTLIGSIFNYPINMIRSVFNFEFMGINVAMLVTFIISIVIVIFIVHKFKK